MKNCQNCKNYYIIHGKKGNVVDDGCKLETEIPFFDRDSYIGNTETDSCDRWEGYDGRTEE